MDPYSTTTNEFARVLQEACIVGPQTTLKNYTSPREALNALIQWHVDVALDPQVSARAAALVEQVPIAPDTECPDWAKKMSNEALCECIVEDMDRLVDGSWIPDTHSCDAVADIAREMLRRLELPRVPTDYVLVPKNIHPLSDTARPKVIALLKDAPDARGFNDENDYYEDWWWQLTEAACERNN